MACFEDDIFDFYETVETQALPDLQEHNTNDGDSIE